MSLRIKLICISVIIVLLLLLHVWDVNRQVTATVDKIKIQQQIKSLKAVDEVDNINKELLHNALQSLSEKDQQVSDITTKYNDTLELLRSRNSRAHSGSATTTGTQSTCTGRNLYREDAEFLAGEAARADKILVERNYYYTQYEQARRELLKFKESSSSNVTNNK